VQTFFFDLETDEFGGWDSPTFYVHLRNPPETGADDFFSLSLDKLAEGAYRVDTMSHHKRPWYSAKGIPDSVISEAARIFGTIKSSSNRCRVRVNESRNSDAEKVWRRLCTDGLAKYYEADDRYVYVGDARNG
jgi:hypothetical protein